MHRSIATLAENSLTDLTGSGLSIEGRLLPVFVILLVSMDEAICFSEGMCIY
jgi:hypothetical protein